MKICLKSKSKEKEVHTVRLRMQDRIPKRIQVPCELLCSYHIEARDGYYILALEVLGQLSIVCQRCLKSFEYSYQNKTQLAVCVNEMLAESLMHQYDCIVVHEHELSLVEIVTDELHLFLPEMHENSVDCDRETSQWISSNNEILSTTLGLSIKTR